MNTPDTLLLLDAARFAAHKHRDQRRKDREATPYINHPIQVAALLADVGGVRDARVLAAALLHDTIEDTDTTPEEIEARFGAEVLALVLEMTDDKTLPKARRKELQIEHAPGKSSGAALIKLSDKACNVHDISHSPPDNWTHERLVGYLDWTERVVGALPPVNPALRQHYEATLGEARRLLDAF